MQNCKAPGSSDQSGIDAFSIDFEILFFMVSKKGKSNHHPFPFLRNMEYYAVVVAL